jgi:RNA polymerase sigma-70 factor (ECF subfamily)
VTRSDGSSGADAGRQARAERFTEARPRLVGLAYRMLGSRTDADDVVQDAWLRYQAGGVEPDNPDAWLTTVTTRLALDRLRSAPVRRERYVGPWLPEPVRTRYGVDWTDALAAGVAVDGARAAPDAVPTGSDPAEVVDRAASLTLGFLVVLDTLAPEDRAIFLLADVFRMPFAEIASVVGRSPDACRQAASRARRRVREAAPTASGGPRAGEWQRAAALAVALEAGDVDATLELLSPDAVLVSDGGADRHAARRPVRGADRVTRFLVNTAARRGPETAVELAEINAAPAIILRPVDADPVVMTVEFGASGRVDAVRLVLAPAKLTALDADALEW